MSPSFKILAISAVTAALATPAAAQGVVTQKNISLGDGAKHRANRARKVYQLGVQGGGQRG